MIAKRGYIMEKLFDAFCIGLYRVSVKIANVILYIGAAMITLTVVLVMPVYIIQALFNLTFLAAVKWYLAVVAGVAAIYGLYRLIKRGEELDLEERKETDDV